MRLDGTFLSDNKGNVLTYDYALNFANGYALVANYTVDAMYGTYKVYNFIDTTGDTPFIFKFTREGEGLYYFNSLVKSGDTNTLVSTYRFKSSGAGAWYVIELYDGVIEAISFTVPEEFNDRKNLMYYRSPYEMTPFKFSENYGTSSPLSRVRIYKWKKEGIYDYEHNCRMSDEEIAAVRERRAREAEEAAAIKAEKTEE